MSDPLLARTREIAEDFLSNVDERPVYPSLTFHQLVAALGGPLQERSIEPVVVIEQLAAAADPGLVATPGPRYFGFVTGASLPAALAADWLTSAWDQNAGLCVLSPAAAAVEHVAAGWLLDVLGLPATASVGFVTGATMANVTAMAAARHEVLRRVGWDVEANGLHGAPRVTVIAGADAHASIRSAARLVGLGASTIVSIDADEQGRLRPDHLRTVLNRTESPAIVCAQAGNVNTGAFDPLREIEAIAHAKGAWLHVDGAFGLWAAAAPSLRHLVDGAPGADSWTVDGHKWLNVPYDSGFVIVAHPAAHAASMTQSAAYLLRANERERDCQEWTPEASRRARGIAAYAALRSLGRRGLDDLVTRCCSCARRIAARLRVEDGVHVLNDVVLNQVLVRFQSRSGANISPAVAARFQREAVCWAGGTQWRGEPAVRISVSAWKTTEEDVDRSVESIVRAHAASR